MDNSAEWHKVVRIRDHLDGATIEAKHLYGETEKEKLKELFAIFEQTQVHCIQGPTKIKHINGIGYCM
ncbi:hypothetical protein BG003_002879, partial [Podila horticola]